MFFFCIFFVLHRFFIAGFIAIKFNLQNNTYIINIIKYSLYAILIFQILCIVFLLINLIIKPIIQIKNSSKQNNKKYYSNMVRIYKIEENTNIAINIGTIISKNACNIFIREIYGLIELCKKNDQWFLICIVTSLILLLILFNFSGFYKLLDSTEKFCFEDIRANIILAITVINFLILAITLFWKIESEKLVCLRNFISILEKAVNLARELDISKKSSINSEEIL